MKVLSVNVGAERTQPRRDGLEITGIYKLPVAGGVEVTHEGLPGDFIGDLKNHGGPDQAVYLYGEPDYRWWAAELGRELEPGTFGENLTLSEFESAGYRIGDRLRVAQVLLEFTAPRIPCSTLARRMRDLEFAKRYADAARPGMYCRVLRPGTIEAGEDAVLEPYTGEAVTGLDVFRENYRRPHDAAELRRQLLAPVSIRTRAAWEKQLRKLEEAAASE